MKQVGRKYNPESNLDAVYSIESIDSIHQKSKLRKVVIPFIEAEMLMHIFHAMEQRCGH